MGTLDWLPERAWRYHYRHATTIMLSVDARSCGNRNANHHSLWEHFWRYTFLKNRQKSTKIYLRKNNQCPQNFKPNENHLQDSVEHVRMHRVVLTGCPRKFGALRYSNFNAGQYCCRFLVDFVDFLLIFVDFSLGLCFDFLEPTF